jgi:formate hydrogenlyase subunit 3/multisubunit Na+/H+ antiporter MnhD subunit
MTDREGFKVVAWFLAVPLALLIGIVVYYLIIKKSQVDDLMNHGCSEELARSIVNRNFYQEQVQNNYSACTGVQQ